MSRDKLPQTHVIIGKLVGEAMLSVAKTLKLMLLIAWYSLRYPLTESVIDYEKARVYNKPPDV